MSHSKKLSDYPSDVQDFVKSDRQWFREHRLAHAKSMLVRQPSQFWKDVVEILTP